MCAWNLELLVNFYRLYNSLHISVFRLNKQLYPSLFLIQQYTSQSICLYIKYMHYSSCKGAIKMVIVFFRSLYKHLCKHKTGYQYISWKSSLIDITHSHIFKISFYGIWNKVHKSYKNNKKEHLLLRISFNA